MHSEEAGYEISLQGHLDARWGSRFEEMRVKNQFDQQGLPITVLSGVLADQAALHGVIAKIRDIGIPVVSVTRVAPALMAEDDQDHAGPSRESAMRSGRDARGMETEG